MISCLAKIGSINFCPKTMDYSKAFWLKHVNYNNGFLLYVYISLPVFHLCTSLLLLLLLCKTATVPRERTAR